MPLSGVMTDWTTYAAWGLGGISGIGLGYAKTGPVVSVLDSLLSRFQVQSLGGFDMGVLLGGAVEIMVGLHFIHFDGGAFMALAGRFVAALIIGHGAGLLLQALGVANPAVSAGLTA